MKISRRQFLNYSGVAATASLLGSLSHCHRSAKRSDRPNIIILFSDELALEYLSCYGGKISTPNLDKLAANGLRFTNAFSAAPMCTPSRFGLLTGRYPGHCSHPDFLADYPTDEPYIIAWNTFVDSSIPTVARILSQNGYTTGMAGKWHVGKLPDHLERPQFEADDDPTDEAVDRKLRKHQEIMAEQVKKDAGFDYAASVAWDNFDTFPVAKLRYHNFPWITKGAVDFLEQQAKRDQPFFLYVATTAVHGPHHAEAFKQDLRYTAGGKIDAVTQFALPSTEIQSRLEQIPAHETHRYAGMACLDHHLGVLRQKLEQLNLAENTLIFFMADHNTEPGKATCFDKGFRVPMLVSWPGKITPNTSTHALVQSVDILPTILDAAQVPLEPALKLYGKSLVPIFSETGTRIRDYVYLESGYARAISDGEYKYIALHFPPKIIQQMENGTLDYAPNHLNVWKQAHSQIAIEHYPAYFDPDQLYDLKNDPYEQHNLASDPAHQAVLKRLKVALRQQLATFDHPYDLTEAPFMKSEKYRQLVRKTQAIGTDYIPWLPRDHGKIVWPPVE